MNARIFLSCTLLLTVFDHLLAANEASPTKPQLEEVAAFPKQQVTGVTVSKTGRVFVNFPFWSDDHSVSVAEVLPGGQLKPFPDEAWNAKEGPPQKRFVCVQSVVVDDADMLWVLDPASPKMEGVVAGGPKLIKFDLNSNQAVQTIAFNEKTAPAKSYLNDVRIDNASGHAFITESGMGALIVVDLKSGQARRVLDDHPSTQAEKGKKLVVDGFDLKDPKTGKTPQIQADGIAYDQKGGWLYYHALTGETMYRIKADDLRDASLKSEDLGKKVENMGKTAAPDGMLMSADGSTVYLAAFEQNAIVAFDTKTRKQTTVLSDPRLQWPDTLAWGPEGHLYITTSQIHRTPKFHDGKSQVKEPYRVYRLKIAGQSGAAGGATKNQ